MLKLTVFLLVLGQFASISARCTRIALTSAVVVLVLHFLTPITNIYITI